MSFEPMIHFAIAASLGLIVGFQRQVVESPTAGIRTFALIAMFGATCGILSTFSTPWLIPIGVIAIAALLFVGNLHKYKQGKFDPGLTTEMAALIVYMASVAVTFGLIHFSVLLVGVTVLLLYSKEKMHGFIDRIGSAEMKTIMQFLLVALVILPLMPDKNFGPAQAFNPFQMWLPVVFIVGVSVIGFLLFKLFSAKVGIVLSGVLGGVISSTATTVSYSKQTKSKPSLALVAVNIIMIASAVAYLRVLVEVFMVTADLFKKMYLPLVVMLMWMCVVALVHMLFIQKAEKQSTIKIEGGSELKTALVFAVIFVAVSFVLVMVKSMWGDRWLYPVAVLSGLADVDAITLSVSRMAAAGGLSPSHAWQLILTSSLSNLAFKAGLAAFLGNSELRKRCFLLLGMSLLGGICILAFWPVNS